MRAVFDTGPFIHLDEIDRLRFINSFELVLTTKEIFNETRITKKLSKIKKITVKKLDSKHKDIAFYLIQKHALDLGESTGISLCKQERVKKFFTDDLDARDTAKHLGFEAHGTLAIALRCLRKKIITKKECVKLIIELYKNSTLYLTKHLVNLVIKEVEKY